MAGWDDILTELNHTMSPSDFVRRKYLKQLSECTGRNTIAYYSAFLTRPNVQNIDINDSDMTGFMNALKGMDCTKGLDLILHTPRRIAKRQQRLLLVTFGANLIMIFALLCHR